MAEQLPAEALQIIDALPVDGSRSGNLRLRERLGMDAVRYGAEAGRLKALGLVVAGRGRGGSLALSEKGQALRAEVSGVPVQPSEPPTPPAVATPAPRQAGRGRKATGAEPLGFEDTLWKAADKLRGSMDSGEYKHVVLGLVFLKYIDDAFGERRDRLAADLAAEGFGGVEVQELLESRDEYTAEGVFWVPPEARWGHLRANAKQPEIGKLIDNWSGPCGPTTIVRSPPRR